MICVSPILHRLRAFVHETRGTVSVEAMIMLPLLLWAFLAMFVFFDAYRQTSNNQKAAFTVSDMISRETSPINDAYLDATQELFGVLARSTRGARIRVTVVKYSEADKRYEVVWSKTRGGATGLDQTGITDLADRLPTVLDAEQFILVESWSLYDAPFRVGLDGKTISTFVFTRPRFAPQVKWVDPIA